MINRINKNDLMYLYHFPKEWLFLLFVDGNLAAKEKGWKSFEEREPGCLKTFFNGFEFALDHLGQNFNLESILTLHKIVTDGLTTNVGKLTSHIRDDDLDSFVYILQEMSTEKGIEECIQRERSRKKGELRARLMDGEIDYVKQDSTHLGSELFKKLGQITWQFHHLFGKEIIENEINNILFDYSNEINHANDNDEKLLAIAKCIHRLQLTHPFSDANGRLFINIMLNSFLMENGFPPAIWYQPNIFDMYSSGELVDAIKDAMSHTLFLIEHPNARLFGYDVSTMSQTDKIKLASFTNSLVAKLADVRSLTDESKLQRNLRNFKVYLNTAWEGKINLHRAVVLGDTDTVQKMLEEGIDLKHLSPINTSPLYRGLSPLHLAAKFGQHEIADMLLKADPNLINQLSMDGNTAIHYAIESQHITLIKMLLENNASLTLKNNLGQTPLHTAARFLPPSLFYEIYYQAKKFASVPDMKTLFENATVGNNTALVQDLLGKFPSEISSPADRNDLLKFAIHHSKADIFRIMVETWYPNGINSNDMTELFYETAKNKCASAFQYLLQQDGHQADFDNEIINKLMNIFCVMYENHFLDKTNIREAIVKNAADIDKFNSAFSVLKENHMLSLLSLDDFCHTLLTTPEHAYELAKAMVCLEENNLNQEKYRKVILANPAANKIAPLVNHLIKNKAIDIMPYILSGDNLIQRIEIAALLVRLNLHDRIQQLDEHHLLDKEQATETTRALCPCGSSVCFICVYYLHTHYNLVSLIRWSVTRYFL